MTAIQDAIEEYDVDFLRLQFTDVLGTVKNVSIPVDQVGKAVEAGVWFDGSSIDGFARIHESDMRLHPDPDTFTVLPWVHADRDGVTAARVICNVSTEGNGRFQGDPRTVLKQEIDRVSEQGYTFHVGPEPEFFVFEHDGESARTPIPQDAGGYFDLAPRDLAEPLRRDIMINLSRIGFDVEAGHHEVAAGQHEIDFAHADALTTADRITTFRTVVRATAEMHGLHATFMPKPLDEKNGSGMHVHLSLFEDGENAFHDPDDDQVLSEIGYQFLAGVMEHAPALTAVCNPAVNSYKRLVPGYEAPVYTSWSTANRSALIRVPAARTPASTRIELRSPDPSCNPYLALAAILRAGMDGIEKELSPPDAVDKNIYDLTPRERDERGIKTLPSTLGEALTALEEDPIIQDVLGDHVTDAFLRAKRAEWNEFCGAVTDWERERYVEKV